MNSSAAKNCAEALRAWLRDDLGSGATVYPQRDVEEGIAGNMLVRFSVSVRDSDVCDLLMMAKKQGRIVMPGYVIRVSQVEAKGHVEASGRYARRDFVVHFRAVTR